MRRFVFVAAIGCHATTNTPHASEAMPLPGETSHGASTDEPSFRLDPAEHPGRLSEDQIDAVLQYAHPEVTACYERVLAVSPDVQGTAITIFIIGTDGAVTAASSSGVESRLARCIDDVVARRVFPPPRGGTVKVRYPFTFARSRVDTAASGSRGDTAAATPSDYRMGSTSAASQSPVRVTCGRRH